MINLIWLDCTTSFLFLKFQNPSNLLLQPLDLEISFWPYFTIPFINFYLLCHTRITSVPTYIKSSLQNIDISFWLNLFTIFFFYIFPEITHHSSTYPSIKPSLFTTTSKLLFTLCTIFPWFMSQYNIKSYPSQTILWDFLVLIHFIAFHLKPIFSCTKE